MLRLHERMIVNGATTCQNLQPCTAAHVWWLWNSWLALGILFGSMTAQDGLVKSEENKSGPENISFFYFHFWLFKEQLCSLFIYSNRFFLLNMESEFEFTVFLNMFFCENSIFPLMDNQSNYKVGTMLKILIKSCNWKCKYMSCSCII